MITTDADVRIEKRVSEDLFILSLKLYRYREWLPGMFLQISLDHKSASEPWLDSRAFSFASWGRDTARILVRREGLFTSKLVEKSQSGFTTTIRYPFGNFLLLSGKNKVFIAGGAGISVFMSYLDYMRFKKVGNENVIIFHSVKKREETLQNIYSSSLPGSVLVRQFITDTKEDTYTGRPSISSFNEEQLEPNAHDFFICGPPQFTAYWVQELSKFQILPKLEQWVYGEVFS